MSRKFFSFCDVLGYGWGVMKANIWFFVGVGLICFGITYIPTVIDFISPKSVNIISRIGIIILGWPISAILGIGLTKIALSFCDEVKPRTGTLFDAWGCFWRYLGTMILYSLICIGGFLLLIVPGIVWGVKFKLSFYFVVDKGLGPVEALKASSRTTMGAKWELLGFGILCSLINLLGLLCLFVGLFATYPTVLVANALVYRQLAAQTPELSESGIGGLRIESNPNGGESSDGGEIPHS